MPKLAIAFTLVALSFQVVHAAGRQAIGGEKVMKLRGPIAMQFRDFAVSSNALSPPEAVPFRRYQTRFLRASQIDVAGKE